MSHLIPRSSKSKGFSLVELLLVLAILGIISAIAIPSFLGQRTRARVIGDAMASAKVLAMGLEARKAENGLYGAVNGDFEWYADGSKTTGPALIPSFQPKGASKMNYRVKIGITGLTYELWVYDPSIGLNVVAYKTDQTGAELERLH